MNDPSVAPYFSGYFDDEAVAVGPLERCADLGRPTPAPPAGPPPASALSLTGSPDSRYHAPLRPIFGRHWAAGEINPSSLLVGTTSKDG
eukprot:1181606-Prymnesium_polylepis.1